MSSNASAWCAAPGAHLEHLALAHGQLLAVHQRPQRALEHVNHLLACVGVLRHERALLQVDLHERLALAGDHLAGDHLGDFIQRKLVPPIERDAPGHRKVHRSIIEGLPGRCRGTTELLAMKTSTLPSSRATATTPDAPRASRKAPTDTFSRDELIKFYRTMLAVAPDRRQGNPAQEPEPDLLPDQRRRPRGDHGRGRPHAPARARLVLSVLPRPRALPRARHDAVRDVPERRRREGRSEQRRPPDAVALGPQGAQHRVAVEPDRHAVPAGRRLRGSRHALRARHGHPGPRAQVRAGRSRVRLGRRRHDERRRVLGVAARRPACASCPSSSSSRTTATRFPCPSKCRRRAAASPRSSSASRPQGHPLRRHRLLRELRGDERGRRVVPRAQGPGARPREGASARTRTRSRTTRSCTRRQASARTKRRAIRSRSSRRC